MNPHLNKSDTEAMANHNLNASSSSRDTLFPATSIGRSSGSKLLSANSSNRPHSLSRESSRESLKVIAHPLLSPSSAGFIPGTDPTSTSSPSATAWDNGLSSNKLGYVPYTRTSRHKPSPASPTSATAHPPHLSHSTSTTASSPSVIVTAAMTSSSPSSSSSAVHADATSKLQLMNLKAAAQALGLDAGTVGWAILEALAGEHGSDEWDVIWEALGIGKAVLLLPSEPLAATPAKGKSVFSKTESSSLITPSFLKNHVLYTESDGGHGRVISLSGLRGIIADSELIFTTTLHPHSQSFRDISSPGTRAKGFASLMPSSSSRLFPESDYPTYTLPTSTPTLSLPPRGSLIPQKPPLPPRRNQPTNQVSTSGNRSGTPDSTKGAASGAGRFAGLASLFGRSASSVSAASLANLPSPAGSRPPSIISDTASVLSNEASSSVLSDNAEQVTAVGHHTSSISVPAFVISSSVNEQEVLRGIWKGLVNDVENILSTPSTLLSSSSLPTSSIFPTATNPIPPILPSILISFLESANALPVLRTSAPHPRFPPRKSYKNNSVTRRLISGSGSGVVEKEDGKEREGKESLRESQPESDLTHELDLSASVSSLHSVNAHNADSDLYYVYEVNPYGVKEGWGSAREEGEAEAGALEAMEELSARWQAFYREVEDVVTEWAESQSEENGQNNSQQILGRAERVLCCVGGVYERLLPAPSPCTIWTTSIKQLFSALNMDDTGQPDPALEPIQIITDSAHDDALGSRIAALLMVDFGLRDLDLDVRSKSGSPSHEKEEAEVEGGEEATREELVMTVLRACGSELCAMEKVYTPTEKAEVMVKAHRVLVDGLTRLPFTIRLKDPELETEPGPQVQSPQEMDEDGSKTAVPWNRDSSFPQPEQDNNADSVEQALEDRNAEITKAKGARESSLDDASKTASFSLDTLFPLLILSVVASNPPRLISHLLFTQRFLFTHRFETSGPSAAGEQAYCLVNLTAVAEFIGSLDLEGVVNARMANGTALSIEDGPMPMPLPMNSLPITIGSRSSSRRASVGSQHSSASGSSAPTTPVLSSSFTLRTRVEQQASALSSSANKVLTGVSGVVDSSIGGFGGLFRNMNVNLSLPGSLPLPSGFGFGDPMSGPVTPALGSAQAAAPWNSHQLHVNPRDAMERKESGFSIKSLKLPAMPNMPGMPTIPNLTRSMTPGPGASREKEMVNVSRPGSARSVRSRRSGAGSLFGDQSTEEEGDSGDVSDEDGEEEESVDDDDDDVDDDDDDDGDSMISRALDDMDGEDSDPSDPTGPSAASDVRSIKSFESMMSDGKRYAKAKSRSASKKKEKHDQRRRKSAIALDTVAGAAGAARKSLSDRLAKVSSGISAAKKTQASPPPSRRSSLLITGSTSVAPLLSSTPQSSRPQSPAGRSLSPQSLKTQTITGLPLPNARFLTCTSAEDLRIGEVKDLLRDYQILVEAVKAAGGYSLPIPLSDNPRGE